MLQAWLSIGYIVLLAILVYAPPCDRKEPWPIGTGCDLASCLMRRLIMQGARHGSQKEILFRKVHQRGQGRCEGWPAMAQQRATFSTLPTQIEALDAVLAIKPADDSQRIAQAEMVKALQTALDARRQRIVVSESGLGKVKWAAILLQAFCTLIVIAMVHSDNRLTCAITLTVFATGVALSLLLIAAYSRPFTGEISVGPDLLKQVITSESAPIQR